MAQADTNANNEMVTADGVPLKVSLRRAMRRKRNTALLLATPLFLFLLITFLLPIGDMLFKSIDNSIVPEQLPRTVEAIDAWNPDESDIPGEPVFEAIVKDIAAGYEERTIGRVARRLNYEVPGASSLFRKTQRRASGLEAPFKEALLDIDEDWGDPEIWRLIKREQDFTTASHYIAAVDMQYSETGAIQAVPDERQIYIPLFWRTLWMSGAITGLCLLLGFPVAFLMANLPLRTSNLLMILVLLPFWTSLLVRTTSWIALLQTEGVINDLLVGVGLVSDDGRLQLIYNQTGTMIAMTHILLPFMILPLYSVMKTIPPSYMRAAKSLGANPMTAFFRVYVPNTVSGMGAGGILVFILAIGYYITPNLVGGRTGIFISNFIASYISGSTQNWGLAAALGVLLLGIVMIMFLLYDKIVGVDNMKLG
jgi:putative spermidine/putrescine transport system permease protein